MNYKAGLYNIIRSYCPSLNKSNKIIKKCVSLSVAQQHCNKSNTSKHNEYFDFFQSAN